jgi:hypothetical protein
MSKLAELLQARNWSDPAANLANPANPANPHSAISNFSNFSEAPRPDSAFTPELQRRIVAMAHRWAYKPEELQDVLRRARENPSGWLSAVAIDEERECEFRSLGLLADASA